MMTKHWNGPGKRTPISAWMYAANNDKPLILSRRYPDQTVPRFFPVPGNTLTEKLSTKLLGGYAVAISPVSSMDNRFPMTARQCTSCTACCEGWLATDSNGIKMQPFSPCAHCTELGCAIYEQRPVDPCRGFNCSWLLDGNLLPDHMKPSKCGAIVMLNREWEGIKVVYAHPTGEKIPEKTMNWLKQFCIGNSIPLVFYENMSADGRLSGMKRTGFGPPSFARAVRDGKETGSPFRMGASPGISKPLNTGQTKNESHTTAMRRR